MPPKGSNSKTVQIRRSYNHNNPSSPAPIPKLNPTAASLLGFLHEGRMTGWELAAAVQRSVGNFWNLTRSQIYKELHSLEAAGLVRATPTGPRERQPYVLTAKGRRAFAEWIAREPGEETIRFPLLLTVYFSQHVPPDRLRRFLRQHLLRHERQLEIEEQQAAHVTDWTSGPALTLRFGMEYERGLLRWMASLPQLAEPIRSARRPRRQP